MNPSRARYDLIIIGSGPGGFRAALVAARRRKRVALIEFRELGGTCLNWGCIPTKSLLAVGERLARHGAGGEAGEADFWNDPNLSDWGKAQAYKNAQVLRLRQGLEGVFKKMAVDVYRGMGALEGPNTVRVNDQRLEGERILLAAGSLTPPLPGFEFDGERVIHNKDLLDAARLPRSMIILGAGPMGCEFANWLVDFGVAVTLVERAENLLPQFDETVSRALRRSFKQKGINVKVRCEAERLEKTAKGVRLHLKGGEVLEAGQLLVAVGRKPRLNPEVIGPVDLKLNRGFIVVNEYFQTSVPSIYAVGDVIGGPMLSHVADAQGAYAAANATGDHIAWPDPPIPGCVYTDPEVAAVGLSEREANARGIATKVGMAYYAMNGRAVASDQTAGLCKVVVRASDDRLIGCHLCGATATEIIAAAATAMSLGATARQLADMIWAHPTYSEVLAEACRACVTSAHD